MEIVLIFEFLEFVRLDVHEILNGIGGTNVEIFNFSVIVQMGL